MVEKIKCVIIEDETPAAEILEKYISEIDFMVLKKSFGNITQALPLLNSEKVDLIFLDINLPGITGLSFAKSLNSSTGIIFTTAYPEYAVEGFELDAIDYLLKPISFERFVKAVSKFLKITDIDKSVSGGQPDNGEKPFLVVKSERRMIKILLDDIVYFEAQKNYLNIVTISTIHRTYQSISEMEDKIPSQMFVRVHRSFIVSLSKITGFSASIVELVRHYKVPIGRQYKSQVGDVIASAQMNR